MRPWSFFPDLNNFEYNLVRLEKKHNHQQKPAEHVLLISTITEFKAYERFNDTFYKKVENQRHDVSKLQIARSMSFYSHPFKRTTSMNMRSLAVLYALPPKQRSLSNFTLDHQHHHTQGSTQRLLYNSTFDLLRISIMQ